MSNILTVQHFYGEYNIPQLGESSVQQAVSDFIRRYEPLALEEVFGHTVSRMLLAAFGLSQPPDSVPLPARWDTLLNGGDYYLSGVPFRFPGVANVDSLSFLAAYIFYWWARNEATITTTQGEAKPKPGGIIPTSSVIRQVRAWNLFIDLGITAREFVFYASDASGNLLFPEAGRSYLKPLRNINQFGI